ARGTLRRLKEGERPAATLITRDFNLAQRIHRAEAVEVARVLASPPESLRPVRDSEILLIDPSSLSELPPPAVISGWLRDFDVVVSFCEDVAKVKDLPEGVLRTDLAVWLDGEAPDNRRPAPASTEDLAGIPARPHTIVLYNPKGGVGKSTLAAALAYRILQRLGLKTGLLDLDVAGGDLTQYLGLKDCPTLMDAAAYGEDVTVELVEQFVTKHRCGVEILPSPGRPELIELAVWERLFPTLRCMQRLYDVLVVDTPSGGGWAPSHTVAREAHMLLCPLSSNPVSFDRLKVALDHLEAQGTIRCVLNRYSRGAPVGEGDIRSLFGVACIGIIPDLGVSVPLSVAKGNPLSFHEPESPMGEAMDAIIRELFGVAKLESGRRSWWRRLKNRVISKGARILDG
ncbi:MAG: CpaE family protein, partial [Clostridia bacterium]